MSRPRPDERTPLPLRAYRGCPQSPRGTRPALALALAAAFGCGAAGGAPAAEAPVIRSVKDGPWSAPSTWEPAGVPGAGVRVVITPGTRVVYDVASEAVVRSVRVAGHLSFARDRDTLLNVGNIRVQPGEPEPAGEGAGVEDVKDVDGHGGGAAKPGGHGGGGGAKPGSGHGHTGPAPERYDAVLEIGAPGEPIPAGHTARVRLHFLSGMSEDASPAIVARPGGRLEFHGAPMERTWVKLGADAAAGDRAVTLARPVPGWRAGDEVIVTAGYSHRRDPSRVEERVIAAVDGVKLTLDAPLESEHPGSGDFRCEVANLSRNVVVESADPGGVRGHTMHHWGSAGSISYARFAGLGKRGVLGRYPIHFHMVRDTMRGSSVVGAAVVDSHNRWVTVHSTEYLLVRDCVGYRAAGHGFFLEDATEVYNVLQRNLAVGARSGRRMKGQALPFDPNDGAGFWWANGKNTLLGNVSTGNEEYGYRYDCQRTSRFDPTLPVRGPDGEMRAVDVRTIPVWRFEGNESHGDDLYGVVIAANGNRQPDSPIRDERMLQRIVSGIDWTGPDRRHPHRVRGLKIWDAHYGFRPHSANMLMEDVQIHAAAYGIYRPAFDHHVYRNLRLSRVGPEPFNRGMDDASAQFGPVAVDGLEISDCGNSSQPHPLVHMTDNALREDAVCHFRRVVLKGNHPRRVVFNRGGSVRADPFVQRSVPYYLHDHFGPGRDALIASTKAVDIVGADGDGAADENGDGVANAAAEKAEVVDTRRFHRAPPLTGDQSVIREVDDVPFPDVLQPVDDEPPATAITWPARGVAAAAPGGRLTVRGFTTDDGPVAKVLVNGVPARDLGDGFHRWEVTLEGVRPGHLKLQAHAEDAAGNRERTPHRLVVVVVE